MKMQLVRPTELTTAEVTNYVRCRGSDGVMAGLRFDCLVFPAAFNFVLQPSNLRSCPTATAGNVWPPPFVPHIIAHCNLNDGYSDPQRYISSQPSTARHALCR
jgi:hypothetical protein